MKRVLAMLSLLWATTAFAQDHTPTVVAVKSALEAANVDLSGPCGAFAITGRVAYALRAEGYGLIAKNASQNGCDTAQGRFSVDAVALPDGSAFDILINAETENIPAWQVTGATSPANWRAPFDLGGVEPPPPPAPYPICPPQTEEHDAILSLMGDIQSQVLAFREWAEREIAEVRAEHRAQTPEIEKGKTPLWQILIGILGALAGTIGATK
jgi:hypothetical protein